MGKVNRCLKRGYVILTAIIGASGVLLLGATLFSHGLHYDMMDELHIGITSSYAISSILILLTITGIYGACKEAKWALILFTVLMGLATIYMLINTFVALIVFPRHHMVIDEELSITMPLSQSSDEARERLNHIQREYECCGVKHGYQDWGYDIPETCLCTEHSVSECVTTPKNTSLYDDKNSTRIYNQPCLQFLLREDTIVFDIGITVLIFISLIFVTSVALCIAIVVQLFRRQADVPTVVYSSEAKAGNYSCLVESADGVVI